VRESVTEALPLPQTWNAVATDGQSVLWNIQAFPANGEDSTGKGDVYWSSRGPEGWSQTFVTPPGRACCPALPMPAWATKDLKAIVWHVFNATIDPTDGDPVGSAGIQAFQDLYRRDADGTFIRITQGSQAPPVVGERVNFVGASADGRRVVFRDDRRLEPDAASDGGVYAREGDTTVLVSRDEAGSGVFVAQGVGVSDDGGTVVFTGNVETQLFLRNENLTHTIRVADVPPGFSLRFESLSSDGSKVVFSTAAALTPDDADSSVDLYQYDTTSHALSRISAPSGAPAGAGPGNSDACTIALPGAAQCDVQPIRVSRDGTRIYFVSPERLDGTQGTDGSVNMYLYEHGQVQFVAALDPSDPALGSNPVARHVRWSPDGSKLLFESRARLTAYDNASHVEIYMHDIAGHSIVCVSCRPSGTPPVGDASLSTGPSLMFQASPMTPANADEHGTLIFFNSFDAIVPTDTNGRNDVYEYATGSRTPSLISSGTSQRDSTYIGNGLDGKDVFFLTTDTLDPADRNGGVYKLYDARVGGGPSAPSGSSACRGSQCRTAQAVPQPASPATGLAGLLPPKRSSQTIPRLKVSRARTSRGTTARLTVKVSAAGRVRVSGAGLAAKSVTARRAATYHVTVRLSRASVARLRRTRRVALTANVRFVPEHGVTRSVRVRLSFVLSSKSKVR
jgi:hypothetical protein